MDEVAVGDVVVVRAGEVVPVDGLIVAGDADLDESALTGEPMPVVYGRGGSVRSGTTNAGEAFELRAVRPAAESAYAALVRLVREVEAQRAPFVRLADRYAIIFLPVTAVVAASRGASPETPSVHSLSLWSPRRARSSSLLRLRSSPASRGLLRRRHCQRCRGDRATRCRLDRTARQDGHLRSALQGSNVSCRSTALSPGLLHLAASLDQLSAHALAEALVHDASGKPSS